MGIAFVFLYQIASLYIFQDMIQNLYFYTTKSYSPPINTKLFHDFGNAVSACSIIFNFASYNDPEQLLSSRRGKVLPQAKPGGCSSVLLRTEHPPDVDFVIIVSPSKGELSCIHSISLKICLIKNTPVFFSALTHHHLLPASVTSHEIPQNKTFKVFITGVYFFNLFTTFWNGTQLITSKGL